MSHERGVTGVPLLYVICNRLYPPCSGNDPTFGKQESAYTSIDPELISRAPILHPDADEGNGNEELEAKGPFTITFLMDTKKVWAILHAQYTTSLAWQHVKKYSTMQNGRQVWRTLHTFFFGDDRVSTMHSTAAISRTTPSTSNVLHTWSSTINCPLSSSLESRA